MLKCLRAPQPYHVQSFSSQASPASWLLPPPWLQSLATRTLDVPECRTHKAAEHQPSTLRHQ